MLQLDGEARCVWQVNHQRHHDVDRPRRSRDPHVSCGVRPYMLARRGDGCYSVMRPRRAEAR